MQREDRQKRFLPPCMFSSEFQAVFAVLHQLRVVCVCVEITTTPIAQVLSTFPLYMRIQV